VFGLENELVHQLSLSLSLSNPNPWVPHLHAQQNTLLSIHGELQVRRGNVLQGTNTP